VGIHAHRPGQCLTAPPERAQKKTQRLHKEWLNPESNGPPACPNQEELLNSEAVPPVGIWALGHMTEVEYDSPKSTTHRESEGVSQNIGERPGILWNILVMTRIDSDISINTVATEGESSRACNPRLYCHRVNLRIDCTEYCVN